VSAADDLRDASLTSGLSDEQRAELLAAGDEVSFVPGDELFREGRPAERFWVLTAGQIELTRSIANDTIVVATMSTPGQWAGGLTAWGVGDDGHSVYRATGRAITDGRCFVVPSDELGRLVGQWSPFAKHMIMGVYQTVRGIDAAARERQSLVALGTLAAGLAHEINNPASASLRTVEALRETGDYMVTSLIELARFGITADQFLEIDRLRLELQVRSATDSGAIARADREEFAGVWMEDHEVALAWRFAPVLAAHDVDEAWLSELQRLVGDDALAPALSWASSTIGAAGLLDELTEATTRITHLVKDVKTYSQMDRAELQRIDVHEGIESTLAMLAPKLHDVDVVRVFQTDLPRIEVYAAELNQVWTNLIDNAIDAIDGAGTLTITTSGDASNVVVAITDTGPGIAPDVLGHVFEPFFTTKDVGKGTGLGLDISRRIVVDRHRGEISFQSSPNGTTAFVRLPTDD
jgi:signal transduction histidine kinase